MRDTMRTIDATDAHSCLIGEVFRAHRRSDEVQTPSSLAAQREHLGNAAAHLDVIAVGVGEDPADGFSVTVALPMERDLSPIEGAEGALIQVADAASDMSEREVSPAWCGQMRGLIGVWQRQVATVEMVIQAGG